jgi:clusterin-associated protein 1
MIDSLTSSIETLIKNEETLNEKKMRRSNELELTKKRHAKMKNFRPAFMDEYEKLEKELQQLYLNYVERYRNIEYLEVELEKFRRQEADLIEHNRIKLIKMRQRMQEEERIIMHGGLQGQDDDNFSRVSNAGNGQNPGSLSARNMNRPRAASGKRPAQRSDVNGAKPNVQRGVVQPQAKPVVNGNMYGDSDEESTEYDESEDEESRGLEVSDDEEGMDEDGDDDEEGDSEEESDEDDEDGNDNF